MRTNHEDFCEQVYLLVAAAHPVLDVFGFLNSFKNFHCVQLLLCCQFTVETNLRQRYRGKKSIETLFRAYISKRICSCKKLPNPPVSYKTAKMFHPNQSCCTSAARSPNWAKTFVL